MDGRRLQGRAVTDPGGLVVDGDAVAAWPRRGRNRNHAAEGTGEVASSPAWRLMA